MFAYEFRLDIPYGNTNFFCVEDYPRGGDPPPSYSWSGTMNGRERLLAPRPVVAYRSEDTCMRLPMSDQNFPSRLSYPYSHTALIPQKARTEHRIQSSYHSLYPSVPHSTQVPSRLRATSNSVASSQLAIDGSWSRFEEHACNPPPAAVPIQASRPPIPTALSMQKPLYACPRCPRDFQLPNGLALHLKWHDRVGGSIKNVASCHSQPVGHQTPPRVPHMESSPLDVRGLGLTQLPIQDNSRGGTSSGFSSSSYAALQGANPAPAESMTPSSQGQYTSSLSHERQPQDCALFPDVMQLNLSAGFPTLDNNTYLAPLDDLSVLQPLPFEQCHSTTGGLCVLPPAQELPSSKISY
ncbi:hypothetical protein BJV78DRAFT_495572 [Lactifluus subvellereus]|nr:hypothetical protein BJV78DRAFT_495572 [Lactifluus subvellereus]